MQYSMAFIRLVNGVADSAQKGKVASSVANLAGYAGALWHSQLLHMLWMFTLLTLGIAPGRECSCQ